MKHTLLILGIIVLAAGWLGPLPRLARHSFCAHMTLHMVVVAVASPLLSLGIAGRRFDPVRKVPGLFAPIPASIGELLIVWAWHAPGLHHVARNTMWGLIAEQGMFLAAGMWVWLSAFGCDEHATNSLDGAAKPHGALATFDGDVSRSRGRSAAGVIGLLLTSMHMTFLGALLAMSPRLLYAHHMHGNTTTWLTPLQDQHLGGAVMLVVGGIAYLSGGLWLTLDLVRQRSQHREPDPEEQERVARDQSIKRIAAS